MSEPKQSETPRTDAEESSFDYRIIPKQRHHAVDAEFARELERELIGYADLIKLARSTLENCKTKDSELERENQRLREELEFALNPVHTCHDQCPRIACVMRRDRDQWKACCKSFHDFVCSEIVVGNPDRYVRIKALVAAFDRLNK